MNQPAKIPVLIADDEPLARELLKSYLSDYPRFFTIGEAKDGADTVKKVKKLKPKVLFLDIQMPEMDGLEVLDQLDREALPVIIFVTAYDAHAVQAFEKNAADYILKPFTEARFKNTVARIESILSIDNSKASMKLIETLVEQYKHLSGTDAPLKNYPSKLPVKTNTRIFFVDTDRITFFEAGGDYVAIHTEGKKHLINNSLSLLEETLDPGKFVRIHRSVIVNIAEILEFRPHFNGEYYVMMRSGDKLKMSRTYKDQVRRILGNCF